MKILDKALVGTLESCDIQIMVLPNENQGIDIQLKSTVEKQFGKQIKKVIKEALEKMNVKDAVIVATDKGALDCTIKARVQCAVLRACGVDKNYDWEALS